MAEQPSNPHDAFARHILGRTVNAASELRAVLPEHIVQRANWNTLRLLPGSYVSPQLRSRYSDLPFSVELDGDDAIIYVLTEHQSSSDHLMMRSQRQVRRPRSRPARAAGDRRTTRYC
jgi:predicted transposase YdaD